MKRFGLICFFCMLLYSSVFSQEAKKIDEFGVLPCGDFMARMDMVFQEWKKSPESNIYVVYYGQRYRKSELWNKKTKSNDLIKLDYPHREDGLAWAKSIPLYLTTMSYYSPKDRNNLKNKIILINGDYEDDKKLEIWLALNDTDIPKPTPTYTEQDLVFKATTPQKTPDYTKCYEGF